jgi:cyclopropane fatty-acyl-phospholipid synthase-like methyltransferase
MLFENDCDLIDFGCSKGGSLRYAQSVLGGANSIGLDISASKVQQTWGIGF